MNKHLIITLGLCVFILSGCEKSRLDDEVRQLCKKDGGVKVYEMAILSPGKYAKYIRHIPSKENSNSSDEYYYEMETLYLKKGDPEMWKSIFRIVRRSDGKNMGEFIRYVRRGGDIPGPWHPSSFGCPDITPHKPDLETSVFHRGDK